MAHCFYFLVDPQEGLDWIGSVDLRNSDLAGCCPEFQNRGFQIWIQNQSMLNRPSFPLLEK